MKCECGFESSKINRLPFYCRCGRVYRGSMTEPSRVPAKSPPPPKPAGGPGTELKKILAELGIKTDASCGCENKARQMDRWGVAGCREHFAEIVAWLQDAKKKTTWRKTLFATIKAATSGLALQLNPLDVAGSVIDLAIRRAELSALATSPTAAAPSRTAAESNGTPSH